MGSATSSPGSRWRRFLIETAARKSDRSRIGAFLPNLFKCEIPLSLVPLEFLFGETVRVIFLCQLVHLYAHLLGPANFELRFTIDMVSEKTIVNTFVMFFLSVNSFAASLPRIEGFSFAVTSTMGTLLLDHEVRDRECIQS